MAKRKKPRAPKKGKGHLSESKSDEAPSPAKKMAAVSSTSQMEEAQVSSCTSLPVDSGAELPGEASVSLSGFSCTCCSFSASSRSILDDHMEQHKLKCLWCPFSSLSHLEVIHHCKFAHNKKSTEMDTIPCHACVCCNFVTYVQEHLEKHIALKHPDKPFRSVSKIISKELSACVRQDDTNFAQTLSNNTSRSHFMKTEPDSHSGAASNPIIIDVVSEVSEGIKSETASDSMPEGTTDPASDSINRQLLISYLLSDFGASELKAESGAVETKCDAGGAAVMEVKLERLYCLTCPYNSISIDEVKCHTLGQHPVGAAAATYNEKGESASMDDTTFFCVRQCCTYSSFDYSSYQRHLVDCCALQKSLCVLERERLKTTVMYMLDCQRKYSLRCEDVFLNLALVCLGTPSQANLALASASSNLGSQTSLPLNIENVNKPSVASEDHSSPPETLFIHLPPHSQLTSSAGVTSYAQHDNIQTPYSVCLRSAQRCQSTNRGTSKVHTTGHMLESTGDKYVSIRDTSSLSHSPSVLPVNSTSIPSDVPVNSSSMSINLPVKLSSFPSDVEIYSSLASSDVLLNSSNTQSNACFHPSSPSSNVLVNSNSQSSNVLFHSSNTSNVPINLLINQNTAASVHNLLLGANGASLANQPNALSTFRQCFSTTDNLNQTSLASNSAAYINPDATNLRHSFPSNTNPVSHAGQQQPGVLVNSAGESCYVTDWQHQNSLAGHTGTGSFSGSNNTSLVEYSDSRMAPMHSVNHAEEDQSNFKMGCPPPSSLQSSLANTGGEFFLNVTTAQNQDMSGNFSYISADGQGIGLRQMQLAGSYHNLPVSPSGMIAERIVSEQKCDVSARAATINQIAPSSVKNISPSNQLNTLRGRTVYGQESSNPLTADINQGQSNSINTTLSTSQQCKTVEGRTVFGQQSGTFKTASNNQNASQYNTVERRATCAQNRQSGILTGTRFQQGPPGNHPDTYLRYEQQPGNLTSTSFKQSVTGNQNETPPRTVDPVVSQKTSQMQKHTVTLSENSAQQNPTDSNTILVFDMTGSKSKLHELTYSNQSQLAPSAFYQATSLSTQDQKRHGAVHLTGSAGQSGINGNQAVSAGTPRLHSTVPCNSADHNSATQFSSSSVGQNGHFTSKNEHFTGKNEHFTGKNDSVNSYFGLQGAEYTGNNRTICSALPEQLSSTWVIQSASTKPSFERGSSYINQGAQSLSSVSVHTGSRMAAAPQQGNLPRPMMAASPQQANPLRPMVISALPPSIHHQNPVMRRSFTGTRIAAATGTCPIRLPASVPPQSRRGRVAHQSQRGRAPAKSQRIMAGRTRVSHNSVNCDNSDDDIIITSGFSPEDQQKSQPQCRSSGFRLPVVQPQGTSSANGCQDSQISKAHTARAAFDATPEDEVEILCAVAGETGSGLTQGSGSEMSRKVRPADSLSTPRSSQNNSVSWNVKDNFGSGLNDLYSDIVYSSIRLASKPPPTSHSAVGPTAPPRREVAQSNVSANQQSMARPPAYSEHINLASRVSTVHYPSPESTQIRAGLKQISPAGLPSSVSSHKQMQRAPPPVHLQKITPSKTSTSNITPSKTSTSNITPLKLQYQQQPVIVVDADGPTPSKQAHRTSYVNQESHQEVIVIDSDISAECRQSHNSPNREPAQDVVILDADPSKHLQQTETNNLKTAETPECVIILDGDSAEKSVNRDKTPFAVTGHSQAVSNRKLSRPSFPVPNTKGKNTMPPQSAGLNINKRNVYKSKPHQSFTPAPHGSSVNSGASPVYGQQNFAGSNSSSPAPRSTVRTPRTASASPVSVTHINKCLDSTVAPRGPPPASRDTNVQNRNGPRSGTNTSVSGAGNYSPVPPASVSHLNHYPDSAVAQRGPQTASRDTNVQNRNGPRSGNNTSASGVGNYSPVPPDSASPASVSHSNHYPDSAVAQRGPQTAPRGTSAQNRNGPQIAPGLASVFITHQNHYPGSIVPQKGPQPASGGTRVQNRNGPQMVSMLKNSSIASMPSASPVSVSYPNYYSDSAVTHRGPQSASRSTHFLDTNGPETVTNTPVASEISNPPAGSINVLVASGLSSVINSEGASGYSEKTGTPGILEKEAPTTGVPCLPDKPQLVPDSAGKENHTDVGNHTELSSSKINQPKLPKNLPSLLLAQFKKCADLKNLKNRTQNSAVSSITAGACSQRNFLDAVAGGAIPNTDEFSSLPSGCAGKAGEVLSTPPSLQKQPECFSVIKDGAAQDVTKLKESIATDSAVDSDKIFIYDLDVNEKQATFPVNSEDIFIFESDVNKQQQESVSTGQNRQNMMTDASSGPEINKSASVASARNVNLLNSSVSEPRKSASAKVSRAHPTDVKNSSQSGHSRSVQTVKQNSPHLHNQMKDPPVLHNQSKGSPDAHNQMKDPPVLHNQSKDSPGAHNQLKDSPVLHKQLKDSPGLQNRLRDSSHVTNHLEDSVAALLPDVDSQVVRPQEFQVTNITKASPSSNPKEHHADNQSVPTPSPADSSSKVVTKGRGRSKKVIKKQEVDETSKILSEETMKQMPEEICQNESENKELAVEKKAVRHSDRLLKTMLKDFIINASDSDVPLSDDSEFHLEDEDLDGGSDSEWCDETGKNKAKSKILDFLSDPTAFNTSLKGHFKCWLCQKLYARCTAAKDHIVKKHVAGLCVIDVDRSKEADSVCLLMFCPRSCVYATNTLAAINSHMQTCSRPFLITEGNNYTDINRAFLDKKYTELVNTPLETVLNSAARRKSKDPAKAQRVKKPRHSLTAEQFGRSFHTKVPCPNSSGASSAPVTPSKHTVFADGTFASGASQNTSSFQAHNMQPQWQNQGQELVGPGRAAKKSPVSHQQRSSPWASNGSRQPMQLPVTLTARAAASKDTPTNPSSQNTHQRSLLHSSEQRLIGSSVPVPSGVSASHHLVQPCRMGQSREHEDIYVVDDSEVICLD